MVRKILVWLVVAVFALVGLAVAGTGYIYWSNLSRFNQTYTITIDPVAIPEATDEVLEYGQHVATIRGCTDCHGQDMGGYTLIDDPALGVVYGTNLTTGEHGLPDAYSDEDWIRAIRHGVDTDDTGLLFMPAHESYYLSDEDLGALIAYLKSVAPVDRANRATKFGPIGHLLFWSGELDLVSAELIDHDAPRPVAPKPGITAEYGEYLAVTCIGCHGNNYAGGPIPGVPPDWPPASNLTPAGPLGGATFEDYKQAMRFGRTFDGRIIDPQYMPWPSMGQMTDEELEATWVFFQSLPPAEVRN